MNSQPGGGESLQSKPEGCAPGTARNKSTSPSIAEEIERFLRTGEADGFYYAWPGNNLIERAKKGRTDLNNALVAEVARRTTQWRPPEAMRDLDLAALARSKAEPMVRGLFPRIEQDAVLALLERAVVFLTPANIEPLIRAAGWSATAWLMANLYLESVGAELLGENAPCIVGFSEGSTCYVSPAYFEQDDPFADFVVHELAHIFHNCKRRRAGLPETRSREWLLDIAFAKRETFAYSCEAYARVLECSATKQQRVSAASRLCDSFGTSSVQVQPGELAELVRRAAERRNGWKVIFEHCVNPRPTRAPSLRG